MGDRAVTINEISDKLVEIHSGDVCMAIVSAEQFGRRSKNGIERNLWKAAAGALRRRRVA